MPIRGLYSFTRLLLAFRERKSFGGATMEMFNILFDLSCNVTGDPKVTFLLDVISSSAIWCQSYFSRATIGFRDSTGGCYPRKRQGSNEAQQGAG